MKIVPAILICSMIFLSCERKPITLYVLETTDLHGELGPAMSSISKYVRDSKAKYGDNLLLLDCGDNMQGTPEVFYSNFVDTTESHIYEDIFNFLPYTALAIGNHDFEAGEKILDRVYSKIKIPILCANIVDADTHKPYFKPYTIVYRGGYKIAILGLVTSCALEWLPESFRYGTSLIPIKEAAEYWTKHIYKKENPDFFIGLFHTGNGSNDPDSATEIIENTQGIHLICCGHIHKADIKEVVNKVGDTVCIMEAGSSASHIAQATITIEPNGKKKPKVSIVSAKVVPTKELPPDKEFNDLIAPFLKRAQDYYDIPVCKIDTTIFSNDALSGPSAWADLLHKSYRKIARHMGYTGTKEVDVTIVSPSLPNAILKAGLLTIKDFILLYPHENTMSIVEMTGNEIEEYLEYTYDLALENPNNPIYDFDSASGIIYRVDKHKPQGERVIIDCMSNGNKFYPERRYYVAMSTFRALGGGGHLGMGLHWNYKKMAARCVAVSKDGIRSTLINLYKSEPMDLTPLNQWNYQ